MKQFQELYPELDDENLFKKPKSRVSVCMNQEKRRTCNNDLYTHTQVQKTTGASTMGGTKNMKNARRKPLASQNGQGRKGQEGRKKKGTGGKQAEDFSWFELDSVFGFGSED